MEKLYLCHRLREDLKISQSYAIKQNWLNLKLHKIYEILDWNSAFPIRILIKPLAGNTKSFNYLNMSSCSGNLSCDNVDFDDFNCKVVKNSKKLLNWLKSSKSPRSWKSSNLILDFRKRDWPISIILWNKKLWGMVVLKVLTNICYPMLYHKKATHSSLNWF